MIQAAIFDLDGTLVETEQLKAISYARAAVELRPDLQEMEVLDAFKDVVGLSRQEVAVALMRRFGLEDAARARTAELGVTMPSEAFVQLRLRSYEAMLADVELLRSYEWPHNVALLHAVRRSGCKAGLATMSYRQQVQRVLDVLGLTQAFDFVATRDDIQNGKPDPEIYLLAARQLGVPPHECMVVEDSVTGVKAGLAAGMYVVAVSTPLTRQRLHESALLSSEHIVDDPAMLPDVVAHVIAHHQRDEHERSQR